MNGRLPVAWVGWVALVACGGEAPRVQAATTNEVSPQSSPGAASFSEDDAAFKRFHSVRFKLFIPLPDRVAWRIDDHLRREFVAVHPPTHSTLVLYEFMEPELVNRAKCETFTRELGFVPPGELRTVEDLATVGPEAYDTRVWVALRTGGGPGASLEGHVFAFGAYVHKCLFFHFSSEVASDRDEPVLSSRLAVARLRILGGLTVEPFDEPPRAKPGRD